MEVTIDDTTYTASHYMYDQPAADSIVWEYRDEEPFFQPGYYPTMYARDPPEKDQFYLIQFYLNDTLLINPAYIVTGDDQFTDNNYLVLELTNRFEAGDTVTFELNEIEQQAKEYFDQYQDLATGAGSPFDGPPSNPEGNFSNGALGLFRASLPFQDRQIIQPDSSD
jgi:hypothetical protein